MNMYPALSFISIALKTLAVIEGLIGMWVLFITSSSINESIQLISGVAILVGSLITYAFSELISVMTDISENTRQTSFAIELIHEDLKRHIKNS